MTGLEERLVELELRFTHQQRFLEELSDVVARQQRDLDLALERLRMLQAAGSAGEVAATPHDDTPPHY
jgi:SlyX protein